MTIPFYSHVRETKSPTIFLLEISVKTSNTVIMCGKSITIFYGIIFNPLMRDGMVTKRSYILESKIFV